MGKRLCFACDLKNNTDLIEQYKVHHAPGHVWPEIIESIKESGIEDMQIFLTGNRMMMIMEVNEDFDLDHKSEMDRKNVKVQEWEKLMWTFQQALPWAAPGEKWVQMHQIFQLEQ